MGYYIMKMKWFAYLICLMALVISAAAPASAADYRTLISQGGRELKTELLSKSDEKITFRLRNSGKKYTVDISSLSAADQEFLADWLPEGAEVKDAGEAGDDEESDEEDLTSQGPKSLYPRTKAEIKDQIKALLKGEGRKNRASQEQKATNILNVYRYLCGVPYNVKNDRGLNSHCEAAAKICLQKGKLSHGFGHYTDKCNLSSMGDMVASVPQYIDDAGGNNRERRGHRRWCLNPAMGKTGFGSGGSAYSGMWSMDHSGRGTRAKFWSYPGKGYFPRDYMHGTAWSYYQQDAVPAKGKIKISIFKLRKVPEKKILSKTEPEGRDIGVKYISTYGNTINFEPDKFTAGDRGIYWVRITGGGLRVGYVVEFF